MPKFSVSVSRSLRLTGCFDVSAEDESSAMAETEKLIADGKFGALATVEFRGEGPDVLWESEDDSVTFEEACPMPDDTDE